MFTRLAGGAAAAVAPAPTSVLKFVARDFAPRIATLWPAPHTDFLGAAAARRHLVCLAVVLGRDLAHVG